LQKIKQTVPKQTLCMVLKRADLKTSY